MQIEGIFNFSMVINGMGIVRAIYREINELLTKKGFYTFLPSTKNLLIWQVETIYI